MMWKTTDKSHCCYLYSKFSSWFSLKDLIEHLAVNNHLIQLDLEVTTALYRPFINNKNNELQRLYNDHENHFI